MISEAITPPHDLQTEKTVLSCLILSDKKRDEIIEILREGDCFFDKFHKTLFKAVLSLYRDSAPIHMDTVLSVDSGSGFAYSDKISRLSEILEVHAPISRIVWDCERLIEMQQRRELLMASYAIRNISLDLEIGADEIVPKAENLVYKINELKERHKSTTVIVKALHDTFVQELNFAENKIGKKIIKTGFYDLDKNIGGGFLGGDKIVIGGRSSNGKTSLCTAIMRNIGSGKNPETCLFFSTDNKKEKIYRKLVSESSGIPINDIKSGKITGLDKQQLIMVSEVISDSKIVIDDTRSLTPVQLRSKARKIKNKYGLGLIIIDFFQNMRDDERHKDIRNMYNSIAYKIWEIGYELDVPMIALSQLTRKTDNRIGGKPSGVQPPQISDLKETGKLEEDADFVFLIHRPEKYNKDEKPGIAELYIAKQRDGAIGRIDLAFRKECTQFANLTKKEWEF